MDRTQTWTRARLHGPQPQTWTTARLHGLQPGVGGRLGGGFQRKPGGSITQYSLGGAAFSVGAAVNCGSGGGAFKLNGGAFIMGGGAFIGGAFISGGGAFGLSIH